MLKKAVLTLITCLLPFSLLADELRLIENAPKSYVVVKGDTLWDISAKFLKDPWLWPKLWRINPEIENPHLIYPGDQLNLVFDEQGVPMLVKGKPRLKWSPKIRTTQKELNPVQTISLNILDPFVRYDMVLSQEQLDEKGYVIGSDEGQKSSLDGFKLYVNRDLELGRSYAIFRKGKEIVRPSDEQVLGYHAKLVGSGKATRRGDMSVKSPSTIYLESAIQEVRSGDVVVPIDDQQMLPSFFTMQPASNNIKGSIVQSSHDVREFGKLEVVFIDQGSQQGLNQGDILSVNRLSPGVVETKEGPVYTSDASRWNRMAASSNSDYQMPEETIGKVMVFKVFDQVSMALILRTTKPLRLMDSVATP